MTASTPRPDPDDRIRERSGKHLPGNLLWSRTPHPFVSYKHEGAYFADLARPTQTLPGSVLAPHSVQDITYEFLFFVWSL